MTPEILFAVNNGEEKRLKLTDKFIRVCIKNNQWQNVIKLKEKVLEARKKMLKEKYSLTFLSMSNFINSYNDVDRH